MDIADRHKKMNYITACPACETQFLLTKEHLKAHRGKVQCGNCEHIFNAKNRLTEVSDDIQSAAEYNASLSVNEPQFDEKPIDAVLNNVLENVPSLQDLASSPMETSEVVAYQQQAIQNAYFDESTSHTPTDIDESYRTEPIHTPIIIEDLTTDARFDKPKLKTNYWLIFFCLLLLLLVGLQSIYAMRTQIAAEHPQFKPLLTQACAVLKCDIPLPKNLDLLSIDDSDMQEDENHESVIKFTSLLINNANYIQAYPNIELTLTSTDDQPVLRRLIHPNEYLKSNSNAAVGIGAREEIRINLAINVKDLAVSGYRVLVVY
jgi:predicted Zn finger-like uncharacterized protein